MDQIPWIFIGYFLDPDFMFRSLGYRIAESSAPRRNLSSLVDLYYLILFSLISKESYLKFGSSRSWIDLRKRLEGPSNYPAYHKEYQLIFLITFSSNSWISMNRLNSSLSILLIQIASILRFLPFFYFANGSSHCRSY